MSSHPPALDGRPDPLGTCGSTRIHIHRAKQRWSWGAVAEGGPCSSAAPGSSNDSLRYLGQITLKCVWQHFPTLGASSSLRPLQKCTEMGGEGGKEALSLVSNSGSVRE